jgi:hypothetical protein
MRTRLLALLALAAASLGTALVVVPSLPAQAGGPDSWTLCTSAADENCIDTASTVDGVPVTTPGATSDPNRDYPEVESVDAHLIVFKAYHGDTTTQTYDVDPNAVFTLVLRTGTFRPREMNATAKNGDFSISGTPGHYRVTVKFQATSIHHTTGACSYDGGCGGVTTKANTSYDRIATGSIEDLVTSGLSTREIYARTGMFAVTNAQNSYLFYDFDTGTLQIRLANPHLTSGGTPVTDGTYDSFIPNAYLTSVMGVPDPAALAASSFVVTKTVSGVTTSAPYSITSVAGGVRIKLTGISFSRPVYKVRIKPTAPGKPRLYRVTKVSKHAAKNRFSAPVANGRARIDGYQARCHAAGKAWRSKKGTRSPLVVSGLPKGRVTCQVRAHNRLGWGRFSTALHS